MFHSTSTGIIVTVRVTPRAGRTAITGIRDGILQVRLAAPPVDGAANDALIELLASTFRIPRRAIAIVAGDKSRTKRVELAGISADKLARLLDGS